MADHAMEALSPAAPVVALKDQEKLNEKGGWKTLPFIIGNEACERMGSLSVLWNLIPYLNERYHMSYLRAAYIVNAVSGTCSLTPILGAYLADSYFGRYNTILGSSFFSLVGLAFLWLSATIKTLQPPECKPPSPELVYECPQSSTSQLLFLIGAFGLIAIGSGGLRSCVYSFGADQFDGDTAQGKRQRQRFFNWFYFGSCLSIFFGITVIVYIQANISWAIGYLVLAITTVISVAIFVAGTGFYRHMPTDVGPYSAMARVLYAAACKRGLPLPSDPLELHTLSAVVKDHGPRLKHTDRLRWLDKAAILKGIDDNGSKDLENSNGNKTSWRLCTIQEVEECKLFISLLPIWGCTIFLSVANTQLGTFTVSQAFFTNHYIGHFNLAPAQLVVVTMSTFIVAIPIYDMMLVPVARRFTKNPRGLSSLQRISVGIVGLTLTMVVAGLVEQRRLSEITIHGRLMHVTWLLPQCMLVGISETFAAIGQFELFYEELPRGMRSFAGAFFWSSIAIGSYLANLVAFVVEKETTKRGQNWLPRNINEGHLDYFYYVQGGICIFTFFVFILCAYRFKHAQYIEDDLGTSKD